MTRRFEADRLFSDHMMLQRQVPVSVWGTGIEGAEITVVCGNSRAAAIVSQGRWKAVLPELEAGGPHELRISSGDEAIVFHDVLIGDVWLAGGQSNMEWVLKATTDADVEVPAADYPRIRYYEVPRVSYDDGQEHRASWQVCTPERAPDFSAVGYHFARYVHEATGVPIGIIGCNWGGTSASCWVDEQTLEQDADLRVYLDEYRALMKDFSWETHREAERLYQAKVDAYNCRAAEGKTGPELGDYPWPPPYSPHSFLRPNGLYHSMLSKTAPFGISGFLYYQGEGDVGRAMLYDKLMAALIGKWREDWHNPELPFLFVQLPVYASEGNPDGEDMAILRESQAIVSERVPNTGLAVILELGEKDDIHPKNKKPVGERLAKIALDMVYHQPVESSGPVYDAMTVADGKAVLHFLHTGEELSARGGGPLIGFEVSGDGETYVPAQAEIDGDTVKAWNRSIPVPTAVRYAWANYTEANLQNSFGLPAGPFRTQRTGRM